MPKILQIILPAFRPIQQFASDRAALHRSGVDNRGGSWTIEGNLLNDAFQVINRGSSHLDNDAVGPRHLITFQNLRNLVHLGDHLATILPHEASQTNNGENW